MARNAATFAKRQRELDQQARRDERAARRAERRGAAVKVSREGEDPDIVGIVPGPQPRAEEEEAGE